MKTTVKTLAIIIALTLQVVATSAKSKETYKNYTQITDKEILVESTNGMKVLFTAFDNNNISIEYFNGNETVSLITPASVLSGVDLEGSMYVEELDDLMQITTTTKDGLMIKIDKRNFEFTFIDKATNTEVFEATETLANATISTKAPKYLFAMN